MWTRSFVAMTVAVGGSVDEAVQALGGTSPDPTRPREVPAHLCAETRALVEQLRAPHRATRQSALVAAVCDVVLAIDESTLR